MNIVTYNPEGDFSSVTDRTLYTTLAFSMLSIKSIHPIRTMYHVHQCMVLVYVHVSLFNLFQPIESKYIDVNFEGGNTQLAALDFAWHNICLKY